MRRQPLIYLNKACFNGVFRVNREGEFNVPYGWKEPPALPSARELELVAQSLHGATLRAEPFEAALARAATGDFVYLIPPIRRSMVRPTSPITRLAASVSMIKGLSPTGRASWIRGAAWSL